MSDVLLYQTLDDGEININNGVVELSPGLETAAYLSLFGGNENDNGNPENPLAWWGNIGESIVNRYRSRTQFLINSLPLITSNLTAIKNAVLEDLNWLLTESIASTVEVEVTIPAMNRVNIVVIIEAQGKRSTFNFTENWEASS